VPTLDWIGKKAVLNHHRQVPFRLLKCDEKLSVGDPNSGNLLIQGDNLEALKALLPYYAGQVKCIYIDPPYNTGNEGWIYNDNVNSPEISRWLGKVVGGESEDLSRHDKWMCMLFPRLSLLRQFLSPDGVIFVSVDENEQRYLAIVLDEIFGSQNRLETLIWKKSYGGGSKSKHIVNLHEYIECFALNIDLIGELSLPPSDKVLKYYRYTDKNLPTRGPYRLQPLATNSMDSRPNLRYPITHKGHEIWPKKQWQWSKDRVMTAIDDDELVFAEKSGNWTVSYKQYLRDAEGTQRPSKAYSIIEGIYTQQGTNEIKAMFGDGKAFDFPKPRGLVEHLIQLVTDKESLILDSFAGSATTGHAVLATNARDGGKRRFLLIEMDSEIAGKVSSKRLAMATAGYKDHLTSESVPGLGGGFRFCTLGKPLFDEQGNIGVNFKRCGNWQKSSVAFR
jgi:adenine-specific DNA-methyltransferase